MCFQQQAAKFICPLLLIIYYTYGIPGADESQGTHNGDGLQRNEDLEQNANQNVEQIHREKRGAGGFTGSRSSYKSPSYYGPFYDDSSYFYPSTVYSSNYWNSQNRQQTKALNFNNSPETQKTTLQPKPAPTIKSEDLDDKQDPSKVYNEYKNNWPNVDPTPVPNRPETYERYNPRNASQRGRF